MHIERETTDDELRRTRAEVLCDRALAQLRDCLDHSADSLTADEPWYREFRAAREHLIAAVLAAGIERHVRVTDLDIGAETQRPLD